jgi:undecaprenyl-diphosphatase
VNAISSPPRQSDGARRGNWAAVAAIIALAALWLAMLLLGGGALDRSFAAALYVGGDPALVLTARRVTFFGEPTLLIGAGFLIAAWLWWRGRGRFALGLLLVILIGRALSEIQKYWVARPRPELEPHLVIVKTSSFPSGHATSSMIFYLTLALALTPTGTRRRLAVIVAVLVSLLIGLSRVMLGVHWPSDVIGGWSFGLLWVLLALRPAERLLVGDSPPSSKRL